MKQIGTPISSTFQGIGCITVFATLSCGLAYKAYYDKDIWAGISSVGCVAITGLVTNNFIAFWSENVADNIIGDIMDYSLGH